MGVSAFMNKMDEITQLAPAIKRLPEQYGSVDLDLKNLKERVVNNYVTYLQVQDTMRLFQDDTLKKINSSLEAQMRGLKDQIVADLPD